MLTGRRTADLKIARERVASADYQNAEPLLRKLLVRDARDGEVLHLLGRSRLATGDVTSAVRLLQRAVVASPTNASAWADLGQGMVRAGNLKGSVEAFRRSVQMQPDQVNTRLSYAQVLIATGAGKVALQELEKLPPSARMSPRYFNILGAAHHSLGRLEVALKSYDAAIALSPGNVGSLMNRTKVLADLVKSQRVDLCQTAEY